MIVYGHRSFDLEPRRVLRDLHTRIAAAADAPPHSQLLEWLVDVGEVESAAADALMPDMDGEHEALHEWRTVSGPIAAAACASWYGDVDTIPAALYRAKCGIERLLGGSLPGVVRARTAEGFACYALYPEQYMSAAEQIVAHGHAQSVFCLGLRSIGAILAHVVAATLQRGGVWPVVRSVRPRGHPFDRHVRIDRSFERLIESSRCEWFAIVDEGPGLSGSSFAAAAELLLSLGVPRDRIVLVPAWDARPELLNSERGRRTWRTCRRFIGQHDPFRRYRDRDDLSGGRWRPGVLGPAKGWPAVHPQHERPKFLDSGGARIARFAGIGKTGQRRRRRAEMLHDAGFGVRPLDITDGALELEWCEGRPVRAISPEFLNRAAEYLAFIRSHFSTNSPDDTCQLAEMIETNAGEAGLALDVEVLAREGSAAPTERVAVDGRMLPYEWIETSSGFIKADALDHHDDDFFPGCRDIAWDVAGLSVEGDLDAAAMTMLVASYRRASGDVDVERRLPFYEAAYAAYRLGYAHLAARTVTDEIEARRFRLLEVRYANRLRRFERSA